MTFGRYCRAVPIWRRRICRSSTSSPPTVIAVRAPRSSGGAEIRRLRPAPTAPSTTACADVPSAAVAAPPPAVRHTPSPCGAHCRSWRAPPPCRPVGSGSPLSGCDGYQLRVPRASSSAAPSAALFPSAPPAAVRHRSPSAAVPQCPPSTPSVRSHMRCSTGQSGL